MIGHHNEGVDAHMIISASNIYDGGFNDFSCSVEHYLTVDHVAEQMLAFSQTDGDEVAPSAPVIKLH